MRLQGVLHRVELLVDVVKGHVVSDLIIEDELTTLAIGKPSKDLVPKWPIFPSTPCSETVEISSDSNSCISVNSRWPGVVGDISLPTTFGMHVVNGCFGQ